MYLKSILTFALVAILSCLTSAAIAQSGARSAPAGSGTINAPIVSGSATRSAPALPRPEFAQPVQPAGPVFQDSGLPADGSSTRGSIPSAGNVGVAPVAQPAPVVLGSSGCGCGATSGPIYSAPYTPCYQSAPTFSPAVNYSSGPIYSSAPSYVAPSPAYSIPAPAYSAPPVYGFGQPSYAPSFGGGGCSRCQRGF